MGTGISGLGVYIPGLYLNVEKTIDEWHKADRDRLQPHFSIMERGVSSPDEDTATMGLMAATQAIQYAGLPVDEIDALCLGTRTSPYETRPASTFLSEALSFSRSIYTSDIQAGNRSGTTAIKLGAALVQSQSANHALVVAGDTLSRYACAGSVGEIYASCGAAAFIISDRNPIAEILQMQSMRFDHGKGKEDSDEYNRNLMKNHLFIRLKENEDIISENVSSAVNEFMKKHNHRPEDYQHAVLQQPYEYLPKKIAELCGFTEDQIRTGLVVKRIGDTGCAASLLGLATVLESARPDETILCVAYDLNGCDLITIRTTNAIMERKEQETSLAKRIRNREEVSYGASLKYEKKLLREKNPFNAFM